MILGRFLFIALLSVVSIGECQVIYKMRMDIYEVRQNGSVKSTYDTVVYWGMKQDTICFGFNADIKCFYPLARSHYRQDKKRRRDAQYIQMNDTKGNRLFILQDYLDDEYCLRFVSSNLGDVLILITNIDFGVPNYTFNSHRVDKRFPYKGQN